MTVRQFRLRLDTASMPEQNRLLAKLLREARDTDVWLFISPAEAWRRWPALAPQLGRRRGFWEFSVWSLAEGRVAWLTTN